MEVNHHFLPLHALECDASGNIPYLSYSFWEREEGDSVTTVKGGKK